MSIIPIISGIICEFNPLHNGHATLMEKMQEQGTTHIVAVMSGNFVQRGTCACFDKWARTRAALACGVDLVVELPLPWAIAGAEPFARGGIFLLNALGCVNQVAFGSECGQAAPLQNLAKTLLSPAFHQELRQQLQRNPGISFAQTRRRTVEALCGPETAALLDFPNNILGIEYCKAIETFGTTLTPFTIQRKGAGYHETGAPVSSLPSATQIRRLLEETPFADLSPYLPSAAATVFQEEIREGRGAVSMQLLETAILSHLRRMTPDTLRRLPEVGEGLEYRLYGAIRQAGSLEDLYMLVKSKRYTHARIRRILLAAFLEVQADDTKKPPPYLRILGMNARGMELLKRFKKSPGNALPLLTQYSQTTALPSRAQRIFSLEEQATDLFGLAFSPPRTCGQERFRGIIIENET